MAAIGKNTDTSSSTTPSDLFSPELPFPTDCFPFLNWSNDRDESDREKAVVFRSLVSTMKFQPALNVSLEAKAVQFLESVTLLSQWPASIFLSGLGLTTDYSSTKFVQSIVVLLSSPNLAIIKPVMELLSSLIKWCSPRTHLALVKADLIPQVINTLHPLSISFSEAVDIHINLIPIIDNKVWLSTPSHGQK
ncbi:hypothetical protein BLNAU_18674 [Blattamonas nauphoetae]|uniref:Uncharacterized protein n=1 Tax=Blattamonas nauphoetae TaxID=2049346 RepID=A0ABQ9X4A3_9EUKA|nr:hypothetical protein BLNAU_18674 [Blattamonas nauphoetae]